MNKGIFRILIAALGLGFALFFGITIIPSLIEHPNIIGAFVAGFVNPYSSGYATDVIVCWLILVVWIIYEYPKVKYGWVCILLGIMPGVAVGFALYLLLRLSQLSGSDSRLL